MAKTMPAPWVLNIVTELLRDPSEDLSSSSDLPSSPVFIPPSGRPRVVQVLKVYSNNNIIIVNDKKHSVAVFLSNDCVDSFVKNSNQNLSSIESSMIKLERWHFSTTIQCLGGRGVSLLTDLGISTPVAINCSRISSLGAYGCSTIGRPVDINSVPAIRKTLAGMRYITLAERLSTRVFGTPHLPDCNGQFLLPSHLYDGKNYVLKLHHCLISGQQRRKLNLDGRNIKEVSAIGASSAGERQEDTVDEADMTETEQEDDPWDVSEELAALGATNMSMIERQEVLGHRDNHPSVAMYEEAANSYAMDMELRDVDEDDGELRPSPRIIQDGDVDTVKCRHVVPLLSLESALKMQQDMGINLNSFAKESITPTLTGSTGECPPSQLPSTKPTESTVVDHDSQLFFTQHSTFDSERLENIEGLVIKEGEEMRRNLIPSIATANPSNDSISVSDTSASFPLADSQQSFLAFLASQNEINKSARPFIHHPQAAGENDCKSKGKNGLDMVEEDMELATQPQVEYIATPSPPSSSKKYKKRSRSGIKKPNATFTRSPASSLKSTPASARGSVKAQGRGQHISSMNDSPVQEATQGEVNIAFYQYSLGGSIENDSGYPGSTPDIDVAHVTTIGSEYVGRRISKKFKNLGRFEGTVVSYDEPYYLIHYDDGDIERKVSRKSVEKWLLKNVPLESISSTQKPTTTPPVAKTRGRKKRMLSELESSLTSPPALQQKHHKPSRKGTEAQSLDVPPKRANIFGANSGNSGHTFQAGSSSGSSSHDSILSEHASEAAKLALRSLFQ